MYKNFIAIDQYGNKHFLDEHPRKELCDLVGCKHVDKMYRDTPTGPKHVGYVIGGHWFEVLRLSPLED